MTTEILCNSGGRAVWCLWGIFLLSGQLVELLGANFDSHLHFRMNQDRVLAPRHSHHLSANYPQTSATCVTLCHIWKVLWHINTQLERSLLPCGIIVDNTLSKLFQLPICTPHPISKWNFIQGALGVPLVLVQWRLGAPIIPALGINRIQTECHGEMWPGQTSNASQSCSYLSGCEDHGIFRQWQLKKKSTWLIKWEDRDVLSRVGFLGFNLGDLMQLSDLSGWRIEPWQRSLWRLFFCVMSIWITLLFIASSSPWICGLWTQWGPSLSLFSVAPRYLAKGLAGTLTAAGSAWPWRAWALPTGWSNFIRNTTGREGRG